MKNWLDENGKIFGLINPVDLGIIILLLALGIKVLSDYRPAPLDLTENQVTVGVLVKNVPSYVARSITVGQDFFQDGTNVYLGKIISQKTEPAVLLLEDDGKIIVSHSPRNIDLRLELKRNARIITGPARTGVYLGKLAVRVGDGLNAHTLYTSVKGEVEYLRTKQ